VEKTSSTLFKVRHFIGYKPEYHADSSFQRGHLEKTENLENIG